jgi:hypothetical protein
MASFRGRPSLRQILGGALADDYPCRPCLCDFRWHCRIGTRGGVGVRRRSTYFFEVAVAAETVLEAGRTGDAVVD